MEYDSKDHCAPSPEKDNAIANALTFGFAAGVAATLAGIKLIKVVFGSK